MRQRKGLLEQLRVQVAVIGFEADERAAKWLQQTKSPFALLLDPERVVYRAYGVENESRSIQMSADIIIDSTGILRFAHRNENPTDRPPTATLLDTLRELPTPN